MVTAAGRCGGRMNESVFSAVLDADALRERVRFAGSELDGILAAGGCSMATKSRHSPGCMSPISVSAAVPGFHVTVCFVPWASMTMTRSHAGSSRRNVSVE